MVPSLPTGPRPEARPLAGEGAAPGWGTSLDAAPRSGLARPDLIAKPSSSLRTAGQRDVIKRDHARPQSDFLARVSHPTERASGRRASDLSLAMHSVPKRQTKGSGKVAARCPAQTNG
jgi:hypothetical protein